MKKRKKTGEPSLREKLSQSFLEALTADFAINGPAVIEKMRATHPERYAELAAKMIMTAEPQQKADGWIRTGAGVPRPAFICDQCARPVISIFPQPKPRL
jgi:hypothetical protein